MTLEQKIARVQELAQQKTKIDAELSVLLGGEVRKGRPPKVPAPPTDEKPVTFP
jgi:hypothetical protein